MPGDEPYNPMDLSKKPPKKGRFTNWIRAHRRWVIVGLIIVVALAGLAAWWLIGNSSQGMPKTRTISASAKVSSFYSPLTGERVDSESATTAAVTAIMIENSPSARPQSGLKDAGVVYEAVAEGGITRFIALYQQQKPELVGPVRSLRMYYLDWAAPYQPSITHVGGSLFALNEVRNGNYRDFDQFFNADYFWRANDRSAPHNVYTNFTKIDQFNSNKGYMTSEFESFPRTDGKPSSTPNATNLSLNFSSPAYNTSYQYDASSNSYARSEGGAAHLDREKGQISPNVVVALHVDMSLVLEDGYRERITTTGSGKAEVFQNGTVTEATWSKDSRTAPLRLLDSTGKPVSLVRGQTWISAIPNSGGSVSWQ